MKRARRTTERANRITRRSHLLLQLLAFFRSQLQMASFTILLRNRHLVRPAATAPLKRHNGRAGAKQGMQTVMSGALPVPCRGALLAALVIVAVAAALSGCSSLYSESATAGAGIAGAAIAGSVTNN